MPFTPEAPFPKERGQPLRSRDWNQLVTEVQRLDTDKVDKKNPDSLQGPLTIQSSLGIGAGIATPKAALHLAGGQWDVTNSEGDLRIGSDTLRLKIGVATGGGGAGDVRIRAQGGTNRLMLGSGTVDVLTLQPDGGIFSGNLSVSGQLNFGAQVRQMINLWQTSYGIGVQASTQYYRTESNFAWYRGGSHANGQFDAGGGVLQMCLRNDRLGISTDNPQGRLHVDDVNWGSNPVRISGMPSSSVGPSLDLDASTGAGGRNYSLISVGGSAGAPAGSLGIYDNAASAYRLVIQGNGNVGIGTTTPQSRLDVDGAIRAGNSDIYFTEANHNHTGIGNATGFAAIENTASHNTLMILGRMMASPSRRSVSIWDQLTVFSGGQQIKFGIPSGPYAGDGIRGEPNLWLDAASKVFLKTGFTTNAMDVAERFKTIELLEPGQVVVIDEREKEAVKPCSQLHDTKVLGIVSTEPGFVLGIDDEHVPIALCGRVPCYVDADIAPIAVGDLLTTSPTLGHAQKVLDRAEAAGSILGKALEPLEKGQGKILVFVMQQ